ncbi:MAG: Collagenase-related protease [Bacteroidetes bacterium]|nr:Collagenase-related protease [Bacteroidota bacterium]
MKLRTLYLPLLLLTLTSFTWFQVDDWLLEREKKGIKVFTRKGKWGKLRDSKADMILPSTKVEEVVKFLTDFDNYPNWMPRCRTAKILARFSDSEFIGYTVVKCPWPLADRDCVVRVKVQRDPATGIVVINETSEPKYINKKDNVVRIEQMFATWRIVPKGDGTQVTNEYSSNPGGGIPDWMTNTQSVDNPYDMFTTIQNALPSSKSGKGH